MNPSENKLDFRDQKSLLNENLENVEINHKNRKMYNPNNNGLINKVSFLRKNKNEERHRNNDNDNLKIHASKNSINFSSFNPYRYKSENDEKYKTFNNFPNSRISKSRENVCFSSSSTFRIQLTNPINKLKYLDNNLKNKKIDISSHRKIENIVNKKHLTQNKILELFSNENEKDVCRINLVFKENKQVNKLKYITPFHLKDLLTKEKSEIKNPFQDSKLYQIDNSLDKKEEMRSFAFKVKEVDKFDLKHFHRKSKSSFLKNTSDEPMIQANLLNEKSNLEETLRNNKEGNFKIIPENKSSGVQCAFDIKSIDSPTKNSKNSADDIKENSLNNCNSLIKNAEIRENIRFEKPKISEEDSTNILNINIYNTHLKGGIQEIYRSIFQNKIKIERKKKTKTPNFMKSTISEQNKILRLKKVQSDKLNLNKNQDDNENCYIKYNDHKLNFRNTNEKFKKFFQIANSEEANQIKYGIVIKKKTRSILKGAANKESYQTNSTNCLNLNLNQNHNNINKIKLNKHHSSLISNQKDSKYLKINDRKEDLLKVYFDKSLNKNLDSHKKYGLIDNCNTSNGFINLGEFNFLERNNFSKNLNNQFNTSLKSKENESNIYILSVNKSPKEKFEKNNDDFVKIKLHSNENLNKIEQIVEKKISKKHYGNNLDRKVLPKSTFNQFYVKDKNSKDKIKILKKELTKDNENVNFMVENFKESLKL